MLSGHLIAFGIIGLATRLKGLPLDEALNSNAMGNFLILER